jgi:hypothetical protein
MKNITLLTAFLFVSMMSMAQLYVTPNGATDSYIYVDDEILYVTDDINLVANNSGSTEASIYLRNQAQLIQSNNVDNIGNGYLSVYQNAPADDAWDYSFWCSPIGNVTTIGNKNFGTSMIYNPTSLTESDQTAFTNGWNGWESPMTISKRWLYMYQGSSGWQWISSNNTVTPGLGFIMKGLGNSNHDQVYDFRGRPRTGDITVPVVQDASTLSGNPYPSALDLNRVFWDTDNNEISEFLYWDEDRSINSHLFIANKGGYGTYVPGTSDANGFVGSGGYQAGIYTAATFFNYSSGGTPTSAYGGSSGGAYDRRFAPIGQGFMIKAGGAVGDGNVIIKNSHRRYIVEGAANDSQFRTPETPSGTSFNSSANNRNPITTGNLSELGETDNRIPHLRIYTEFVDSHYRDMVLAFSNEATLGYDRGFDGRHPMDGAISEAYFPIESTDNGTSPYVIQTVKFNKDEQIPIAFELDQQTSFIVKAVDEVNFNVDTFIFDNIGNTYQKITGGDQAEFLLPAGEYTDRFFIVFIDLTSTPSPAVAELYTETTQNVGFFQNNRVGQLEVSNPDGYDIKSAILYDMTGKLVFNKSNLGTNTSFTFSTTNLSDGVYLVKLTTVDNISIDYKTIVFNK